MQDIDDVLYEARMKASIMQMWKRHAFLVRIGLIVWFLLVFLMALASWERAFQYLLGYCVCYAHMGGRRNKDQLLARTAFPNWKTLLEYWNKKREQ